MERCPSGRRSTPGKRVYGQLYQGFKSLSLRQKKCRVYLGVFCLCNTSKHRAELRLRGSAHFLCYYFFDFHVDPPFHIMPIVPNIFYFISISQFMKSVNIEQYFFRTFKHNTKYIVYIFISSISNFFQKHIHFKSQ